MTHEFNSHGETAVDRRADPAFSRWARDELWSPGSMGWVWSRFVRLTVGCWSVLSCA